MEPWEAERDEMLDLAQRLAELDDRQWDSPSLCALWRIRDVLAHVTAGAEGAFGAGAIFGGMLLTRSIAKPLGMAIAHLAEVAKGDLSKDAPAEFQARGDEIGTLARAKQLMITNLRKMVQDLSSGVEILSSSSAELSANSGQMSEGGQKTSEKAHSVAAAAEEMIASKVFVTRRERFDGSREICNRGAFRAARVWPLPAALPELPRQSGFQGGPLTRGVARNDSRACL